MGSLYDGNDETDEERFGNSGPGAHMPLLVVLILLVLLARIG
jgi:hypothetical protein